MYKIIGADGKQYGPVPLEQIVGWIQEGRASGGTLAQLEGSTEWKPLSAFPEFAQYFTGPSPLPPVSATQASPSGAGARADWEQLAQQYIQRNRWQGAGHYIGRAWNLLIKNFWPIIGVYLLFCVVSFAAGLTGIGFILVGPLTGGFWTYMLHKIRGQKAEVNDLFSGFSASFLPLMLVSMLGGAMTLVGFLLCLVPGIYLAVAWAFALPLAADKRLEFWPALELSRRVVHKCWFSVFWLVILGGLLLQLLGIVACCIGIFVTMPLFMLAMAYAYQDLFGD